MTKEEAINYLERSMAIGEDYDSRYHNEVLEFIIKELEQEHCEDAVSRTEIQQKINRLWNSNGDKNYCMETLKDFVTELQPVTPTQKWIPVSERLPNIHNCCEKYLVTLEHGGTYVALFTECDGKHWWAYDDVVAWMPLQPSYKGE